MYGENIMSAIASAVGAGLLIAFLLGGVAGYSCSSCGAVGKIRDAVHEVTEP